MQKNLTHRRYYQGYQHQLVRDLAWAIASPPLVVPGGSICCWYGEDWYRQLYRSSVDWLKKLDKQPDALQQRVDAQKDRRMGRYFETLWAFWLEHDPRFELLQQNVALRKGGTTLGELDLLVLDKSTGKCLHWEMAVKFYLGVGDTRLQCNWHGPGKKDRLDKKVEHLRQRQSVIASLPDASQMLADMGLHIDACGVILKGRLFYQCGTTRPNLHPFDACQGHDKGEWLSIEQFAGHFAEGDCFYPLLGKGWMAASAPGPTAKYVSKNNLLEAINAGHYRLPLYLDQAPENVATGRVFLVSDDWSESL